MTNNGLLRENFTLHMQNAGYQWTAHERIIWHQTVPENSCD